MKFFRNSLLIVILIIIHKIIKYISIILPNHIFLLANIYHFCIYLLIFFINILVFFLLYLRDKNLWANIVFNEITFWFKNYYNKIIDDIASIQGFFSILIAYITSFYIKINIKILQIIAYLPKILLIIALSYDVLFMEKFHYSYYFLFLQLFTIISKIILYLSIEINNRILEECTNSIYKITVKELINICEMPLIDYKNYALSDTNIQFFSVEDVFNVSRVTLLELEKLYIIKEKTQNPLSLILFLRLFYIFIFGYIIFYYPLIILI